jgi:hypothetical protein
LGLLAPSATNFAAGDRGCLPAVAASGAADVPSTLQATNVQLVLGTAASATTDVAAGDYALAVRLLCSTSGTCCTTDLCNTMSRIQMSFLAMFMSITLALFGVFKGF